MENSFSSAGRLSLALNSWIISRPGHVNLEGQSPAAADSFSEKLLVHILRPLCQIEGRGQIRNQIRAGFIRVFLHLLLSSLTV